MAVQSCGNALPSPHPAAFGHRFERLRNDAGVHAQNRLGHADASTTLREYAYALPLTDQNVADAIDRHLDHLTTEQPDTTHRPGAPQR